MNGIRIVEFVLCQDGPEFAAVTISTSFTTFPIAGSIAIMEKTVTSNFFIILMF